MLEEDKYQRENWFKIIGLEALPGGEAPNLNPQWSE